MMPNLARVWQYEEEGKRNFSFPFFVVLLRFFYHHHEGKASTSSQFHLHFLINFTKGKHQLRHIFTFTFSSTSRKESTNFVTFSSSLFHQLHESKASTSSRFHLHFFQKKSCMKCELASIKIVLKYV